MGDLEKKDNKKDEIYISFWIMGLKIEKEGSDVMPRRPRKYMKSSFFHIVTQGIQKSYIFEEKQDIKKYESLIKTKSEGIINLAYCIMNNHAHILISTGNVEFMEKWMHDVNTKYAKFYNKKYNRIGHVFNDRYYTQEIANAEHLYRCIKYIHDNPVKAKICRNPEEYPYSSFKGVYDGNIVNVANRLEKIIGKRYNECNNQSIFKKYEYVFFDYEQSNEEICNEFLKEIEKEYALKVIDLRNFEVFTKIIKTLKVNFGLSNLEIGEKIGVNRETIRRIVKENESKW